jgi:hypothetical protein
MVVIIGVHHFPRFEFLLVTLFATCVKMLLEALFGFQNQSEPLFEIGRAHV